MLNDGNWFTWKARSLDFFISAKLPGIHPTFPNKPTDTDELKAWGDANLHLKPLLASRVPDEHRHLVDELTTVEAAYKALSDHFQRSTMGSRMTARQELYRITHDPSLHISAYIHAAESARAKLKALGVTIEDQEFKDILLMNLDSSLHFIRTTLLTNKVEPDLQSVKDTLNGASSADQTIVKIEGAYMARAARGRSSPHFAGSATDGITDSRGNVWCNTRSAGCHRCGRGRHQAYRCISDMPAEVKNKLFAPSVLETAEAAAALDDFDLDAFNAAFTQARHPVWTHEETIPRSVAM